MLKLLFTIPIASDYLRRTQRSRAQEDPCIGKGLARN